MTLHFIDETVVVRRLNYVNDVASLSTIFTNVGASVQQTDVPVGLSGDGYASRLFTVFMDTSRTIVTGDRIITTAGKELVVKGIKQVNSGSEPYLEISCEESQG